MRLFLQRTRDTIASVKGWRMVLPALLAIATQKPRQIVSPGVDFDWESGCWTHNVFRAYEMLFGRRWGIRFEGLSGIGDDGREYHVFGTFENLIAHCEGLARAWLKSPFGFRIEVVPVPAFAYGLAGAGMNGGMPRIFNFAIATDANSFGVGNSEGTSTSCTWNHTCTGSNRLLSIFGTIGVPLGGPATGLMGTATYNAVGATQVVEQGGNASVSNSGDNVMYVLYAPATGTNSTVVNAAGGKNGWMKGIAASYTGAQQSGTITATGGSYSTSVTTASFSLTAGSATGWVVCGAYDDATNLTSATNLTIRNSSNDARYVFLDSNGTIASGSFTGSVTVLAADHVTMAAYWFDVPAAASTGHSLLLTGVGT